MTLKYQEVAKDLVNKIYQHVYTDKLPSEGELLAEYEVSRNTIRNALGILYNQGLIKRIQGSGYFVTKPLHKETNIMNMANKAGLNQIGNPLIVHSKVLKLEVIQADEELAQFLCCPVGDSVYFVQRLRYTDKELVSLENAYYLKSVVSYLTKEVCENSIFQFIFTHYDISIQHGDEYISIHYLNEEEANLTNYAVNHPTIQVEEVNYQKNEQPFNYSVSYYFQSDLTFYFHVSNYLH